MTGKVRETQKEGRRSAIMQACESLIRETGNTDFSMRLLAAKSGLSLATTYNLIGSKATVLYKLLNSCMDRADTARMTTLRCGDAVEHVFLAADAVIDIYTTDQDFYRPILRFLLGVPEPTHRPLFMDRAYRFWWATVQPLRELGAFAGLYPAQLLARDLQIFFAGTLHFWVHGELSAEEFRAQIRTSIAIRLLSIKRDDNCKSRLLEKIDASSLVMNPILDNV